MFRLFTVLLVSTQVFALYPFSNYSTMCVGRQNCGLIFQHPNFKESNINYRMIERYTPTWPAYTRGNYSFAWAQSHAHAFNFKIWISWFYNSIVPQTIFQKLSVVSVIKSVLAVSDITCQAPQLTDLTWDYANHLPYLFVDPAIQYQQKIYTVNMIPTDETQITNWCSKSYLDSFNPVGAVEGRDVYKFTGYDNLQTSLDWSFRTYYLYGANRGVAIVGLPHDYAMSSTWAGYRDGFYKLSGPRLFYQPANVVGYYKPPNNNTLYFIVYAFGAYNTEVNYLFVDARIISLPNWLTFINDYEYPLY
jgi:hypothetical protein